MTSLWENFLHLFPDQMTHHLCDPSQSPTSLAREASKELWVDQSKSSVPLAVGKDQVREETQARLLLRSGVLYGHAEI